MSELSQKLNGLKAVALGNAQWKLNKRRYYVKLRLDKPLTLANGGVTKDYDTVILTSSNSHTACHDITYQDRIMFDGIIRGFTDNSILMDVIKYSGGSLEQCRRAVRKEKERYNSIIGKD